MHLGDVKEFDVMMNDGNYLDLTARDFDLIESALHTQKKILSVQSEAGGAGAGQRLAELKLLTKRLGRARKSRVTAPAWSLSGLARSLLWGVRT